MRKPVHLAILSLCVGAPWNAAFAQSLSSSPPALTARVVAVGIPGVAAVAPVGRFHAGGPIHDKPEFAAFTQPGRILDPNRVLVTSTSNFGAPLALTSSPEGSVLSIDPNGGTLAVPATFAAAGNQAIALSGRVQLFTAQSPAFLNSVTSPGAASASQPSVANPLGISINNAFGRLWFPSAPQGAKGIGLESILDPGGMPLAGAPSKLLGGVFAGNLTNRPAQVIPGSLNAGAVANALLGMSSDGSKRAVFAVLTADGAIAQAHTEFALDGLAPAGTVSPIPIGPAEGSRITRAGMIFNWVPDRILYITDPVRNVVTALTLTTDDKVFRLKDARHFAPKELDAPVDLAPVVPEVANPGFSSNTTMAGGSDIYVANRGNGTIVRLRQDGTVVAVRRVVLSGGRDLGPGLLNGIAVSPDAQKIWVTVSGTLPDHAGAPGALLELPAFGPGRAAMRDMPHPTLAAHEVKPVKLVDLGAQLFSTDFTPKQGLGPLYNARSCLECHHTPTAGGMGRNGLSVVHRVGRFDGVEFDDLAGLGGPVARAHSVAEIGIPCALAPGPPSQANLISVRNASSLYGLGFIETISDDAIRAGSVMRGNTKGRPNIIHDAQGRERVGRYGWKGDVATLEQFVAEAFRNELGITSPLAPADPIPGDSECAGKPELAWDDDGTTIRAVTAYLALLPPPAHRSRDLSPKGRIVFASIGCADCHTPTLRAVDGRDVPLFSDLLLHDMGPALDDRITQGGARGKDWRTTPLWGVGTRPRLLHDGRATSIKDAILAHDGEAAEVTTRFRRLTEPEQSALLIYVAAL
jgi:Di-haem oxidoreductase, putative peroxidase